MEAQVDEIPAVLHMCNCELITDDSRNTIRTCEAIWEPYQKARAAHGNRQVEIVFNMDPCPRIDPGGLLLLLNAARRDRSIRSLVATENSSGAYHAIVDNIDNLAGALDEARRLNQQRARRFLLRRILDPHEMVREVAEWAEMVRDGTRANAADVALWETQISEVAANTFQHADAPDGVLVAGEAFPQRGYVQLAAIDFGKTIPLCIEAEAKKRSQSLDDGELLAFATQESVTSGCVVQNQGSGLPSLVEMVKNNGGTMQILSRDGFLRVKNRRKYRSKPKKAIGSPILSGTLIVLNLKIN